MATSVISHQKKKIENDSLKLLKFIQENPLCDKKLALKHLGFNNEKTRLLALKLRDEGKINIVTKGTSRNQLYQSISNPVKQKKRKRNFDKYFFESCILSKGQTVRAIVARYVSDHPDIKFPELRQVFEDNLLGNNLYGVIRKLSNANDLPLRYFIKPEHRITLKDGTVLCVCNQVSSKNILPIVNVAIGLGYKIGIAGKNV